MVSALLAVTACTLGDDDPEGPGAVSAADAYAAAIRWYVEMALVTEPTDAESTENAGNTESAGNTENTANTESTANTDQEDDVGPLVVYIAPASGIPIAASDQADVIAELADMSETATVVFADAGDDAIDLEVENQPVKDDGVLLVVGKVVEGPPPVEVSVEVYHNVDESESFEMRIVRSGSDGYTVTAVTQLEQS